VTEGYRTCRLASLDCTDRKWLKAIRSQLNHTVLHWPRQCRRKDCACLTAWMTVVGPGIAQECTACSCILCNRFGRFKEVFRIEMMRSTSPWWLTQCTSSYVDEGKHGAQIPRFKDTGTAVNVNQSCM
jgi:hypothetical protein